MLLNSRVLSRLVLPWLLESKSTVKRSVYSMAIKRRLKDRDTELQMAPMIDCVFLLLIFFMVTAVMKVEPNFTIDRKSVV